MRKQYDDFQQLKLKDMSKSISDMTYRYINPETNTPTKVPSAHYEKILDQVTEKYVAEVASRKILNVIYSELVNLKKENEQYFNQAIMCMDLGINPKDMRVNEQIALQYTTEFFEQKQIVEKKDFHFLSEDIVEAFNDAKSNPDLQSHVVRESNKLEGLDNSHRSNDWER